MKIQQGFLLKKIAGNSIVMPVGEKSIEFQAIITLNETGCFLWEQLQTDKTADELADALLSEYEIDRETAKADVSAFLETIRSVGAIA